MYVTNKNDRIILIYESINEFQNNRTSIHLAYYFGNHYKDLKKAIRLILKFMNDNIKCRSVVIQEL